ncbi:hypothetical protein JCM10450v2_001525 [Rhodotorula kratochvilovae]
MARADTLKISLAGAAQGGGGGGHRAPPIPALLAGGTRTTAVDGAQGGGGPSSAGNALGAPPIPSTSRLYPRPPPRPAPPPAAPSTAAPSKAKPSAAARLRNFFRSSPAQAVPPVAAPPARPTVAPMEKAPSADAAARPRPRVRPATATGAPAQRPRSMLFGTSFGMRSDEKEVKEKETERSEGAPRWKRPFGGARPATASGATGGEAPKPGSFAALAAAQWSGEAPSLRSATQRATSPVRGRKEAPPAQPSTSTGTTALLASAFCPVQASPHPAPASPSLSGTSSPALSGSRRPSTATTAPSSAPSHSTSASPGGLRRGLSFRKASAAAESHDTAGGISSSLRRFAHSFSPSSVASPSSADVPTAPQPSTAAPPPQQQHAQDVRRKPSLAGVKTLLAPAPSMPAPRDSPPAADPLTDAELASWRAAGRAKRVGLASEAEEGLGPLATPGWGGSIGAGGARRGSGESEVLVIGNGCARSSNVPLAPSAGASRRGSAAAQALPFGTLPRASVDTPSPRSSASPFPSAGRRPSDAPSVTFASSHRPSDSPALTFSSRRPSDSPALPFGSRRPSAASGRSSARPRTAPAGGRSPRIDSGALNVLEFVAVDAGRDGEENLPLHFPQTNGGGLDGLAPSAISPFPGSTSPAARRGQFLRRLSTTSSNFSLGSEEDMILSTLAATGASPNPGAGAGNGLFSASPGSSPVLGARPLLAPKPPPQSSLPPSMQHLFAGRPAALGAAALSAPSRRAAPLPAPIQLPASTSSPAGFAAAGQGLGFALPGTPPPRPPRAPGHSLARVPPPQEEQQEHSAWSQLATALSSAPRGKGRPRTAPTPTRPSRSEERERAAAALEGRAVRASEKAVEEKAGPRAWTPPPTPPGSEEIRAGRTRDDAEA